MYEDVNNDGKIDANDQVIIGHSNPRLYYQRIWDSRGRIWRSA